ncbi:MAG: HAMP domain-containing histidine kinase [Deltaproteobacteria bacterium]|nr:HAMP domain-containing histidine kinase [Deltaproteobacteria bacterium]
MRLVLKLVASLMAVVVLVLAIQAFSRVRREIALFEGDTARDHRVMGRMLAAAVQWTWQSQGQASTEQLVEEANQRWSSIQIRWRWLGECPPAGSADPCLPPTRLAELLRQHETWWIESSADQPVLRTMVLVGHGGPKPGLIELAEPLLERRAYIQGSMLRTVVAVGIMAVLCSLVSVLLGMWFVGRPVRRLIAKARRVGDGDFSEPLQLGQRDELGDLAVEMNTMSDRLARATAERQTAIEQLRHAERLSTVGKLASGIAHELGTPLHVVAARAKAIQKGRAEGQAAVEAAAAITEQTERMTAIIRQLLDFARSRRLKATATDLALAVEQTISLLEPLARKAAVTLSCGGETGPLQARLDRSLFQQALTNLVVNSIQAMPQGGALTISLLRAPRTPPGGASKAKACLVVEVRDEGVGIPPEILPSIFDPFFTTKGVSEGTGLGLSVAYGIVEEHGGFIEVQSEPGCGSRFSICLPEEATA